MYNKNRKKPFKQVVIKNKIYVFKQKHQGIPFIKATIN